ncbi:PPC domain-containing protein [Myxococcota bacterium]|nr:PPC domain-containing protein [Myxococcota bacterium]
MDTRTLAGIGILSLVLFACDGDKGIDDDGTSDGGATDGGGDGGGDGGDGGDGGTSGDDCGGDIASACDFQIDAKAGYAQADEVIAEEGDRDFFKMSLGAGQSIAVGTIAYAADGDMEPDTVLRLYDSAGTLLATNDDMPFRLQETDSALYFQAPTDGDYYFEVLEWGDWDGSGGNGGDSYEYTLIAYEVVQLDPEPDNDDFASVVAYTKAGNYVYYGNGWTEDGSLPYQFFGDMDAAGDTDLFPIDWTLKEEDERVWCQYSVWPTWLGDFQPSFALYDGDGNMVAQNDSPVYSLDRYYYYDGAVMMADQGVVFGEMGEVGGGQTYYLEVSDLGGMSGVGTFYPGLMECYTWNTEVVTVEDIDTDNNLPALSRDVLMNESSDGTAWYGYMVGGINAMGIPADELDSWRISSAGTGGSLDGKILNIVLQSKGVGQFLDAAITVYEDDGTTVLTSASSNTFDDNGDPAIESFEIDSDTASIYVVVEAEDAAMVPDANQYLAFIWISEAE